MPTIVRGHHFNTNDVATAFTLNKLVASAVISNLELESSEGGITAGSAPTETMQNGAMAAIYETPLIASAASWSEYNYLLKTNEGLVALFKPLGLETRRFFHATVGALNPGSAFAIAVSGQGATLRSTRTYTELIQPRAIFIGASRFTAATTASDHMTRLTLKGLTPAIQSITAGGSGRPRFFQMDNSSANGRWEHLVTSPELDKVAGLALDFQVASVANTVGWLFGGPIYRSD